MCITVRMSLYIRHHGIFIIISSSIILGNETSSCISYHQHMVSSNIHHHRIHHCINVLDCSNFKNQIVNCFRNGLSKTKFWNCNFTNLRISTIESRAVHKKSWVVHKNSRDVCLDCCHLSPRNLWENSDL